MDLDLVVPAELGPDFAAMQDTLDRAEHLARDGHLLAYPGLPEVIAVRDWACEQVVAQLAGIAPAPWPGTDLERFDRATADAAAPGGVRTAGGRGPGGPGARPAGADLAAVTTSHGWVAAADESNRILAVSDPLARLLGWEPAELVGRRIVALIPHRLREAHVAGFTRHQSTGEVRVLGVPLTVPVLRADGSEVTCRLVIEHVPLPTGRTAYRASFTPQDGDATGTATGTRDATHD
jgi:PAS domain S-box-containing protein